MENETREIEEMAIEGEVIPPPADVATTGSARGVDYFVDWISQSWRNSMEDMLETGRRIVEARNALEHGEFQDMVDKKLPFGIRTAQRLARIAECPHLANATAPSHLPHSWSVLYELIELPSDEFSYLVDSGLVNKNTTLKEMRELKMALRNPPTKTTGASSTANDVSTTNQSNHLDLPGTRNVNQPKKVKLILTVPEATMLQEMFESASKIGMVTQWINKNFTAKDKERPDPDKLAQKFADLNLPEIFFATR